MRSVFPFLIIYICISVFSIASAQDIPERQWSSYRGYRSSGVLDNAGLPDSFNPAENINILWKANIPGLGISSPVIWGKRLFITTAVSQSDKSGFRPGIYGDGEPVKDSSIHEWKVLCFDKITGKKLWEKTSYKGIPAIKRHPKSTHANPSVSTDGRFVVAFFGSEGLYCYDMNGNLQWTRNFGVLKSVAFDYPAAEWEFASSPVIYDGKVIIQCDVLENPFLAVLDLKTGKTIWKVVRDDYPAWSTPNIYKNDDNTCIVVNGFKHMGGYDLATGKELWRLSGGGDVPIPTPVVRNNLIFLNSAHGKFSPIFAVSTGASGDITLRNNASSNQFIKWSIPRGGSYIHTLLMYQDLLYNFNWNGTVNCMDPETGKEIYRGKLGLSRSFVASPVAADGRIFIVDEEGTVYIMKSGDPFRILSEVSLNDICMSSPAITDGIIYFRTQHYLIAVGKK